MIFVKNFLLLSLLVFTMHGASANCGDRVFVSGKPAKLRNAVLKKMESSGYKIVNDYKDSDYSISVYRNNWGGLSVGAPAAMVYRVQKDNASQQIISDRYDDGFGKASLLKFSKKVEQFLRSDRYCD